MFKMWLRTQFHFHGSNRSLVINYQTDLHEIYVRPPKCHFTFYKKNTAVRKVAYCARIYYHTESEDPEVSGASVAPASKFTRRSYCYYWCRELKEGHWSGLRRDNVHTGFCKNRPVISTVKMGTHTLTHGHLIS